MKDRYLFKAKRVDTGEWVTGYLLRDDVTGQYFIHASGNSVNESDKVNEEGCLRFVAFEVDSATICQYTGLTDKNGNKIWENDVVTIKGMVSIGKVLFDKESCSYSIKVGAGRYVRDIGRFTKKIEVIGNIFDNPELLKGE